MFLCLGSDFTHHNGREDFYREKSADENFVLNHILLKMVDWFPKNHLTQVRIQTSFILKGEGVCLVPTNFLVPESFVLADVHIGQVSMFL